MAVGTWLHSKKENFLLIRVDRITRSYQQHELFNIQTNPDILKTIGEMKTVFLVWSGKKSGDFKSSYRCGCTLWQLVSNKNIETLLEDDGWDIGIQQN